MSKHIVLKQKFRFYLSQDYCDYSKYVYGGGKTLEASYSQNIALSSYSSLRPKFPRKGIVCLHLLNDAVHKLR
jgi:hypothetical protein